MASNPLWPEGEDGTHVLLALILERVRNRPVDQITEWDSFAVIAQLMQYQVVTAMDNKDTLKGIEKMLIEHARHQRNIATVLTQMKSTLESIHGVLATQRIPTT